MSTGNRRIFKWLHPNSISRAMSITGFLYFAPALLFFLIFFIYPIINAIYISFTDWNFITPKHFIGLRNYIKLFQSADFIHSLKISLYYAFGLTIPLWILSLGLALLIDTKLRFTRFFQTIYFIPAVISLTVTSLVGQYMFQRLGLINGVFHLLNMTSIPWLSKGSYALLAVIIMSIWQASGYYIIIFLAGLQGIPNIYYEAAKVDGASSHHILFKITLPLLKPTFLFVFIISIIQAFQGFTQFFVMTGGGPGAATKALPLKIYDDAFLHFQMGKATAEAMILLLIMLFFTVIQLKIFGKGVS